MHIDRKFLDYLFSSEAFLKNIKFEALPQEHMQILINALKNVYNIDLERRNKNNQFFQTHSINLRQWLTANIKISNKIARYTRIINKLNKLMNQNKSVLDEDELSGKNR